MSNRHWEFVTDRLLAPVNDKLAVRHGAQYAFKVPEGSFDWDVEFAAVKDRSGNKVREEYLSAWAQPSLVGPDENTVHQLGTKLTWSTGMKGFEPKDVARLMGVVDGLLGSPLQQGEKNELTQKEAPGEEKKAASVRVAEALMSEASVADKVLKTLQKAADSRLVDSKLLQQVEVDDVLSDITDLKDREDKYVIVGYVTSLLVELIRNGQFKPELLYGVLTMFTQKVKEAREAFRESPGEKLNVIGIIEELVMSLCNELKLTPRQTGGFLESLKRLDRDEMCDALCTSVDVFDKVKMMLPRLVVQDVMPPQQAEKVFEDVTSQGPQTPQTLPASPEPKV